MPPAAGDNVSRWRFFRELLVVWLILRLLTSLWIALASTLRPLTAREQLIPLWPPSSSPGPWLERALLAPWERWDAEYYINIVSRGYRLDDGTAQFHPLYPWLATPVNWVIDQPLLALLIISSAATLVFLVVLERLTRLDTDPATARTTVTLTLFSPMAFIFFAPYSEALFLLCAALTLYWARQRAWARAGVAGALATLARQQGLFLAVPLGWELWEASGRNPKRAIAAWRDGLWMGLIPLGLLSWILYRALALSDLQVDWTSPHSVIYSLIISPSATQVVPKQTFMWPWRALWLALQKLWSEPDTDLIINFVLLTGFLVVLALTWRRMRASYRLYTLVIVLVSLAYHTGRFYPYMGLPRHLMLAVPVYAGLGAVVQRPWQRLTLAVPGLLGLFFLLLMYGIEGWVP